MVLFLYEAQIILSEQVENLVKGCGVYDIFSLFEKLYFPDLDAK
jgi:hypothetical protein